MIRNLVKRDIRGRYKGSVLGFIWNFITPLIQVLVYIMVFTAIYHTSLQNYAVYLVSGMAIWIWFSESVSEGSGTFISNSELVKKIYFPRSVLPISTVISKMINFMIMLIIFSIIIVATGHGFNIISLLYLPIYIILSFTFILGLTLLLSSLNVYARDVQYIVGVMLMAWIWVTPIMYYRGDITDNLINSLLQLNPLTYLVEGYQTIFYWKTVPGLSDIAICCAISFITLIIGILAFRHFENGFAEVL